MAIIHRTAIVHEGAQLHETVEVGAYAVIHANVKIGAGTKVGEHCVIDGHTTIGENNVFYRFCSIGGIPQDKKYNYEQTYLEIGNNNTFREFVTVNTGTAQDMGVTRIGDDNWIMAYVHIAHDCQIGSHTIIANTVQLAGHIHIGDWAIIGGMSAAHQFIHIGAHSMTGGMSSIRQDIPPFVLGAGQPYKPAGINTEGLKRRGFSDNQIQVLREAYKIIYLRQLSLEDALVEIKKLQQVHTDTTEHLQLFIDFFETAHRGIGRK
ncbi:acyl-ACP--UDP-N-acetylglucosamine O-acyltransferase [Pelistega sp. NLN82]|uniref:Acyl-[acyl-carrier-protein]--UDP-N-acetylglucosamine O-acyltransferase n=1 Tax=Pelistega ratti TaxID=2652177 RepID=A0A6L9Y3Z0_9BURK|nr:acyl-ACP--UDP-N-acetylglucosamine O-acyltransferase [Pelistega ratti]NEN75160.1 acyl-ACP--UDP-N-acetylglucosamine O-acyltransferase [Pelistega ratti]